MKIFNVKTMKLLVALTFCLSAFTFFAGCKKFVEIPPPTTQLVTTSVFANNATATSAQVAIYVAMWNNVESWSMAQNMGLYADELTNYDQSDAFEVQYYTNALQAINSAGPWSNYYSYIYYANAVISGLQTVKGTSHAVKNQLTGEAEFVRAFCHFYLTNVYGDVPLVLTTDPNVTDKLPRTPRLQVLQQVVTDLQNAQTLLNSNYVDGSDTVSTTERVRPNKAAASALLARVYLYLGDYTGNASYYTKSDSAASAVIADNNYSLSPLSGVFLKNSTEAIWQLQTPQPASYDTPDGEFFVLLGSPSTTGPYNNTTLSPQLLDSFEPNDRRFTNWIGSITEGTTTYYFPYKYKVSQSYEGLEYDIVLRLAEQYLIRAEARVHESNPMGAAADLNMIRARAGLPNTTAKSATELYTAIIHERQVELFTEWGQRWFDLNRAVSAKLTVNANTVLGPPENVCQAKGGTWNPNNNDYQLLFPLPQSEILTDHNLTQNPGY